MRARAWANRAAAAILGRVPLRAARRAAKRQSELGYWRGRIAAEGPLRGDHYERFFTTFFGLSHEDYAGRRVLDIGCGPRGTLEWAGVAAERVGVDPLAGVYERLSRGRHAMRYVRAGAEAIPFPDGHFDVIASFNSLDHVDDLGRAVAEITRVAAPGGALLLVTDVNHAATFTEPQEFSWDVLDAFAGGWEAQDVRRYRKLRDNMMENLEAAVEMPPDATGEPGVLVARLRRSD